jgi:sugar lactone lactonase YvrE
MDAVPSDDDDFWPPVLSLAVDPRNSNVVYVAGSGGIFKSVDGGTMWTSLSSGYSSYTCAGTQPCFEPYYVSSIVIDNSGVLYATAGSWNARLVVRSPDGGTTWTPLNPSLQVPGLEQLAINPANPNTLYVTTADDGIYTINIH